MENVMLNLIDDFLKIDEGEKETWKVEDDLAADWCLDKIREAKAEYNRFEIVINDKIQQLQNRLEKERQKMEQEVSFFESKLREYFETLEEKQLKTTKTMMKYKLPSGELVKKFPGPEFKRDNDKLTEWLEHNGMNEFIEIKKQAKWGELKKKTKVVGNNVVFEDTGEIVEGVEVIERAPEFKVEVE